MPDADAGPTLVQIRQLGPGEPPVGYALPTTSQAFQSCVLFPRHPRTALPSRRPPGMVDYAKFDHVGDDLSDDDAPRRPSVTRLEAGPSYVERKDL